MISRADPAKPDRAEGLGAEKKCFQEKIVRGGALYTVQALHSREIIKAGKDQVDDNEIKEDKEIEPPPAHADERMIDADGLPSGSLHTINVEGSVFVN